MLARAALAAVRADQVRRAQRARALRRGDNQFDVIPVIGDGLDDVREAQVDVLEPIQAVGEDPIDQRLDEGVAPRPAELPGARLDLGDHSTLAIDQPHDVLRGGVRQHLIDQPHRLQRAQRLVVQADPARVVDQLGQLLQHDRPHPLQAEQVGQAEAGRTGTDDQDVGVEVGVEWGGGVAGHR